MSEDGEVPMGQALEKALEGGTKAAQPETPAAPEGQEAGAGTSAEINLESLLDVPVTLSVEIGRSKLAIRELVSLNQGSVVELDREVNEPLDLLVNGTLMARGEVVVVDGQFGLRLIDIVSPRERLKKLK
tara:strand:+ start:2474 stop:2863 length:390 start_codon:yes stop_codon:yes gene_type:complete